MVELTLEQKQAKVYFVHETFRGLKIEIPITHADELTKYKSAILNMLSHIIIDDCDEAMQDDLKTIYALLLHFELNKQKQWSAYYQDFLVRSEEDYFL